MISDYNLEMLDKHCTTMPLNVSYILKQVSLSDLHKTIVKSIILTKRDSRKILLYGSK